MALFQASSVEIRDREEEHTGETVKIEGAITAVTSSSITVLTRDATTAVVAVTSTTTIRHEDQSLTAADLKVSQRVGNERYLTALYLLTVADIRGTSPKVWNGWKVLA